MRDVGLGICSFVRIKALGMMGVFGDVQARTAT